MAQSYLYIGLFHFHYGISSYTGWPPLFAVSSLRVTQAPWELQFLSYLSLSPVSRPMPDMFIKQNLFWLWPAKVGTLSLACIGNILFMSVIDFKIFYWNRLGTYVLYCVHLYLDQGLFLFIFVSQVPDTYCTLRFWSKRWKPSIIEFLLIRIF